MKNHWAKNIRLSFSAGAITAFILFSGCSINADPSLTPPSQSSLSQKKTPTMARGTVLPDDPYFSSSDYANWGDTGL
jgi:hypothetical protein